MLDTVDSHRNRCWRQACNFANRDSVHVFEIRDDYLPVKRLELLDPSGEAIKIDALV